jgi:hypothetical protein
MYRSTGNQDGGRESGNTWKTWRVGQESRNKVSISTELAVDYSQVVK